MSDFTYESKDCSTPLEQYEWDHTWWDEPSRTEDTRIAYIGDSISRGTRRLVTSLSEGSIKCDGFGTSKALDNPFFKDSLKLFFIQMSSCSAILFNNGLHGWHLSEEEYKEKYREMICFLRETYHFPIFILLTTDAAADEERNQRVIKRNRYL